MLFADTYSDHLVFELAEDNTITVKTAMLTILLPILLVLLLIVIIIVLICCCCPAVFARCGCGRRGEKEVKERIYDEVYPPATVYVDEDRGQRAVYDEPRTYRGGPAAYSDVGVQDGGRVVYEDPRLGPRPAGAARQAKKISSNIGSADLQDRIRKVSGFGKQTNI